MATTFKKEGLQNLFNLFYSNQDFKIHTHNTNHVKRSIVYQNNPGLETCLF